jgi:hypothetical protein
MKPSENTAERSLRADLLQMALNTWSCGSQNIRSKQQLSIPRGAQTYRTRFTRSISLLGTGKKVPMPPRCSGRHLNFGAVYLRESASLNPVSLRAYRKSAKKIEAHSSGSEKARGQGPAIQSLSNWSSHLSNNQITELSPKARVASGIAAWIFACPLARLLPNGTGGKI